MKDIQQLAVHGELLDRFAGIRIDSEKGIVTHEGESISLAGAQATVETSGQIDKRVTATRFILTGPLAFALRKKKDNRQLYLTVEGESSVWLAKVNPQREKEARKFAARLNKFAKQFPSNHIIGPGPQAARRNAIDADAEARRLLRP